MDPVNASSTHDGSNSIPELTDVAQLTNFQFMFETVCNSYKVWDIIIGTETRPENDPNEVGINAIERRSREAIMKDFDNRCNLAIRFLTRAIKKNSDLVSVLANDSTPNLTKDPAVYYSRICAHALPNSSLSISNVDDEFNKVVNDKFEDGSLFLKRFSIVANQAIALGVYKRDNVLKAKFAKALCHNDVTLKASLLSSAMIDSQSYGDFCSYAVLLYNTAMSTRSVAESQTNAKKSSAKDTALVARFNSIRGRMSGRGRGRNRHEHVERGNNYRGLFNSRGRSNYDSRPTHGRRGGHSMGRGEKSDDNRYSNDSTANIKCFACKEYGHYANKCPNRTSSFSGNKRKAEEDA
jgi:hypothetical protein